MTPIGFHYFPDEAHYRQADLQTWLPELAALDARYLTLIGSLTRAVPEAFVRGLLDAAIEPIIHIPAVPTRRDTQRVTEAALRTLFTTYARWGVKYVVVYSEPNTRAAWAPADWGQSGLVDRFLDLFIPILQAQKEAGLQPVFPALKAGGDYWDTAFLEAALTGLVQRDLSELARQLTFAVNLWTYNRPVTWGQGGLQRWPATRPYLTPPGSQDQRGFQLFDWYAEIIQTRLGAQRPLLCLAGGPALGDRTDPAFPAVSSIRHASCIQEITRAANNDTLPPHLLNVNFWVLSAGDDSPFAAEAWYQPGGGTLPAVDVLKQAASPAQQAERRRTSETKGLEAEIDLEPTPKTLRHFLLLPVFEWGVSDYHWGAALEFVKAHRPVCGFSPEEATQAHRVTIVGNEQGVSLSVEESLRQAGCQVERLILDAQPLAN